jgi:hypothetical protein
MVSKTKIPSNVYTLLYIKKCEIFIIDTQIVPKKYKQYRSNTWYSPCIRCPTTETEMLLPPTCKDGISTPFCSHERIERQTINSWDDGISELGENWLLVTDELVEFEKSIVEVHRDFKIDINRLKRIYRITPQVSKEKTERSQHVSGWTLKHLDFHRLCPKILPAKDWKGMQVGRTTAVIERT